MQLGLFGSFTGLLVAVPWTKRGFIGFPIFFAGQEYLDFPQKNRMESENFCDHMTTSFDQSMDVLELLGWKFCRGAQVVQDGKMISAKGFHAGRCQAVFGWQIKGSRLYRMDATFSLM